MCKHPYSSIIEMIQHSTGLCTDSRHQSPPGWKSLDMCAVLCCALVMPCRDAISAKAGRDGDGPQVVKYVDLSKTSDSYDKVREWQETGKKRFP